MARHTFGGDVASLAVSVAVDKRLSAANAAVVTFFTAASGGSAVTDLLAADGVTPVTSVTTAADGTLPVFYGPSGVTSVWASVPGASGRRLMTTTDLVGTYVAQARVMFNVKDYGAVGDGVTDDSTAINNAVTAAVATYANRNTTPSSPSYSGIVAGVYFPSGSYLTSGITFGVPIALVGDGPSNTLLKLTAGTTTALITINVSDVTGTSSDDAARALVSGLQLRGNRPDTTTTNGSHGIYFPDAANAQYFGSFTGHDLHIEEFCGSGIYYGVNRNWSFLSNVVSRYNNTNGVHTHSSDHRFVDCDFAANGNAGFRATSGVGVSTVGTNINNNAYGFIFDNGTGGAYWFTGCSIGANKNDGVTGTSTGVGAGGSVSFVNCEFTANNQLATATACDINITSLNLLQVIGCQFTYQSTQVKYLVQYTTCGKIVFAGNVTADRTGGVNLPYSTALFNDYTKIIFAGYNAQSLGTTDGTDLTLGTTNLAVDANGHLAGRGTTPSAAAGTNNGTTPPAPVVHSGSSDQGMEVHFGSGTGPAAGQQAVVTFNRAFSKSPYPVAVAMNAATQALGVYLASVSTTGFNIQTANAPAAGQVNTTYSVHVAVIG